MESKNPVPQDILLNILLLAYDKKVLKKAVFSKSARKDIKRGTATLRRIGSDVLLQIEYLMSDHKVIHRNFDRKALAEELLQLISSYGQINVITTFGECEYRTSKKGKAILIGGDRLFQRLEESNEGTEQLEIVPHNREKNYILQGNEPFLIKLEISDARGRVRDKKQPKFRQINRFLEHIRDITRYLPSMGELIIYDLCCGKSYLSFAAYYYFTSIMGRKVSMTGVDLKPDVIKFCNDTARLLEFDGLSFINLDITKFSPKDRPHLVLSLHACDTANDIVLDFASSMKVDVILSTPCCHHELSGKLNCPPLQFIAEHSMLRQKLCDAATDALRLKKLESEGYSVSALELTDPDDTPKNILLRAIKRSDFDPSSPAALKLKKEYRAAQYFLTGRDD